MGYIYILLFKSKKRTSIMQCSAVSNLVMHCLPMSHKKDAKPKWVNLLFNCLSRIQKTSIMQIPVDSELVLHCR